MIRLLCINPSPLTDNTVSVGLSQLSYTFNENEDATNLMVCVDLTNNVVNRDVILTLTLRAGSALGEWVGPLCIALRHDVLCMGCLLTVLSLYCPLSSSWPGFRSGDCYGHL